MILIKFARRVIKIDNKDLNAMSVIAFGENHPHQMRSHNPLQYLPSAEDLPDSDNTPVDNELQILVANLLGEILAWAWRTRTDWFFGVNMGVYYAPADKTFRKAPAVTGALRKSKEH